MWSNTRVRPDPSKNPQYFLNRPLLPPHKIQNYWCVVKTVAAQMTVVTPTILDFGRIVLNFISYFFTVCKAISTGVDITLFGVMIPFFTDTIVSWIYAQFFYNYCKLLWFQVFPRSFSEWGQEPWILNLKKTVIYTDIQSSIKKTDVKTQKKS